jgi:hypothetical protein
MTASHPSRRWAIAMIAMLAALALAAARTRPAFAEGEIALYGDSDGVVKTTGSRAGTQDSFSAAKLDLFITHAVDRWTFLAETMFEASADTNEYGVDVERVEVGYLFRDWARVFVGRFHTAIGYYNDAFHHGVFFMVPVGRPTAVEFEDGGGLIPAHNIGVHVDGRFEVADDHVRYDLEVANGRAADPLEVQNLRDGNRAKAFNLRLRYEPGGLLEGLIVGGNLYFDSIPANTMAASSETGFPFHFGPLHEWIVGAHAAYFEHDIHFVTEAMMIEHDELDTGARHRTYAAFAEAGHSWDNVTPYARFEHTRFPAEGDPYFLKTYADGYDIASLGVKHSTTDNIALKLQSGVLFSRAPGAKPLFILIGQLAFAF